MTALDVVGIGLVWLLALAWLWALARASARADREMTRLLAQREHEWERHELLEAERRRGLVLYGDGE